MSIATNAVGGNGVQDQPESRVFQGHTGQVSCVVISADGKRALSGSYDDTVRLWDIASGEEIRCFKGHTNWVRSVALSHDGSRVFSGSIDCSARLWDASSGAELYCLNQYKNSIQAVGLSPDGRYLLTGCEDGALRLWSIDSGKEVRCFGEHMTGILCAGFSPDSRMAFAGIGKGVSIWAVETGELMHRIECNRGRLKSVLFSADGKMIVCATDDGSVHVFDVDSEKELNQFNGYNRWLHNAGFTPDGRQVYGSFDQWVDKTFKLIIRRWNLSGDQSFQDFSFIGHTMSINSVAYAPDGRFLISGSNDKSLRLYELK